MATKDKPDLRVQLMDKKTDYCREVAHPVCNRMVSAVLTVTGPGRATRILVTCRDHFDDAKAYGAKLWRGEIQ